MRFNQLLFKKINKKPVSLIVFILMAILMLSSSFTEGYNNFGITKNRDSLNINQELLQEKMKSQQIDLMQNSNNNQIDEKIIKDPSLKGITNSDYSDSVKGDFSGTEPIFTPDMTYTTQNVVQDPSFDTTTWNPWQYTAWATAGNSVEADDKAILTSPSEVILQVHDDNAIGVDEGERINLYQSAKLC